MKSLSRVFKFIKRNKLKNQKGFSLVELMVVVAIIGILAAIAIPNYQKFQARSKQTEARTQLSGLYASERSFIAEWNYGSANLQQIGYSVEGSNMLYNCGWNNSQKQADPATKNVNIESSADRPTGYRGPIANDDDVTNTFRLLPGSISTSVGDGTLHTKSGANADTAMEISEGILTPGACATSACSATTSTACQVCAGYAAGDWTPAAITTEGSFKVNNSIPGSIPFIIGCVGDIDGSQNDEWTMNEEKQLVNSVQGI